MLEWNSSLVLMEDNESGFGLNHIENIDINNPTVAHNLDRSIQIDSMRGTLTKARLEL